MRVKELIKILKQYDEELEITIPHYLEGWKKTYVFYNPHLTVNIEKMVQGKAMYKKLSDEEIDNIYNAYEILVIEGVKV